MGLEDDAGVLKGMRSLHEQKLLHDYTIEVEDQEFKVHKLVMASVSDYFKVMLTGSLVESQTDRVRLEGLNALAVSKMIDFIYRGHSFYWYEASLEDLTECAVYLQVTAALPQIIHCAKSKINKDRTICFQTLSIFQKFSVNDGVKMVLENMISSFDEVLEKWAPEEMTYHDLRNLICVWQNSEWDLFCTIKQWVEVDSESRQQHVSDLMGHLRFALMSLEQLAAFKGSDLHSGCEDSWYEEVDKAVEYHSLPIHIKVLEDSEQSMVRNKSYPFYFHNDGRMLYKVRKEKSWRVCEAFEKPEMEFGIETFVIVNNFLVVSEVFGRDQKWHILDPRTLKWSSMPQLGTPRWAFALVSCNKYLYALGGCPLGTDPLMETDIIERYDFETNSWSLISSKLPCPMYHFGAAVIGSCIYVVGRMDSDVYVPATLDCFDTCTDTWQSRAPPLSCNTYCGLQVMEICNEKVLFVMSDDDMIDNDLYLLIYTPSEDAWFTWDIDIDDDESTKLCRRSNAPVLSNPNNLFLLNYMNREIKDKDMKQGILPTYASWSYSDDKLAVECEIHEVQWENSALECHTQEGQERAFARLMFLSIPPLPFASLNISETQIEHT